MLRRERGWRASREPLLGGRSSVLSGVSVRPAMLLFVMLGPESHSRRTFLRLAAGVVIVAHGAVAGRRALGGGEMTDEPGPATLPLLGLTLLATRLEEMRRFYCEGLGLPLVAEDGASISFRAGHTVLTFEDAGETRHGVPGHQRQPEPGLQRPGSFSR